MATTLGGVLRNIETDADVALGAEVVDFVRPDLGQRIGQGAGVGEIGVMQEELRAGLVGVLVEMVHPIGIERGCPALQPVDLIALGLEQFREVRSILPRNARNERFRHSLFL